jgi:hypothetical protein
MSKNITEKNFDSPDRATPKVSNNQQGMTRRTEPYFEEPRRSKGSLESSGTKRERIVSQ